MELEKLTQKILKGIFVELEASGRHVHVTREQAQILFGQDLTPHRPLSQPGQFLAKERVCVRTEKGEFQNVAVLGPARSHGQVEVSFTDSRALGICPPVRLSGDIGGTPGAQLIGPKGSVTLKEGVIVAKRHIHITPQDAKHFGVKDKQIVKLQTFTDRPVIFEDVCVRVSEEFETFVHLDYDEANACAFQKGDLGRILL